MISDTVLRSLVAAQLDNATGQFNGDISEHRGDLMDRYMAEPYGDEVEGRSKIVMSDVADTIEWIMPELMDIFTAGDDVVEYEPQGQEDEQAAKQETAVANWVMRKNDQFLLLYTWFKDALLQKNGVVKSFWDERTVEEIEEYEDLTPDELLVILAQLAEGADEIEILEQSWENTPEDGAMFSEGEGLEVKIRVKRELKEYKVVNIPPEEFLIHPKWNSIFLDGCPFVAHKATKTVSELIEMGFDRKQVESLPDDDEYAEEEEIERFNSPNNTEYGEGEETDPSMREVTLNECYVYLDRNEDGVAELLQVFMGGGHNEVMKWADGGLAIQEVDQQPFDAITPVLMSHKFFGRSVAELVEDLQRVRTVLIRQMLDNIYLSNNPRPHINMNEANETTIKDVLNVQPGFPIRAKTSTAVTYPSMMQAQSAEFLQAVEYVDHLRENRTGVTKYNQGLDANSLNKTATGIRSIMSASQKKILLIARIFAETGVSCMMRRMHRNLRKGPLKKIAGKIRNQWIEVNPRLWKERTDMTVSVGLGTGDKDQILMRLNALLERQIQALEVGLASREQILHTLHKMVETSGFKAPELFFALGDPPQQGDGGAAALLQIEGMKIQQRQSEAEMKTQADMLKAQRELELKAAQIALERERMMADMQRQNAEMGLKRDDMTGKLFLESEKMNGEKTLSIAELELKDREVAVKEAQAGLAAGELEIKREDVGLKKRAQDMDERDREVETERQDIASILARLAESNATLGENLRAGMEAMGKQIAEGQSRPRKVVYDEDGNVVGVE